MGIKTNKLEVTENITVNGEKVLTKSSLLELVYPVGSLYMSLNNVNPEGFLGGKWEAIKDKFLLSSGDSYVVGSTGGEASHMITQAEAPRLKVPFSQIAGGGGSYGSFTGSGIWTGADNVTSWIELHRFETQSPMSIMPPYLVVNVWKRIA